MGRLQRAYMDCPQPIGYHATISAPHMHATCLELLKDHLGPGKKVQFSYHANQQFNLQAS